MDQSNGLARLPEVEQVSGLSRSSIYRLEASGEFPKRVKLGLRAVGWPRDAVLKWCANRPSAAPNKAA
jgi:prophage regulatory protein